MLFSRLNICPAISDVFALLSGGEPSVSQVQLDRSLRLFKPAVPFSMRPRWRLDIKIEFDAMSKSFDVIENPNYAIA